MAEQCPEHAAVAGRRGASSWLTACLECRRPAEALPCSQQAASACPPENLTWSSFSFSRSAAQRWQVGAWRHAAHVLALKPTIKNEHSFKAVFQPTLRLARLLVNTLYMDGLPVAAAGAEHVRVERAILTECLAAKRHGAVIRERVGVQKHAWLAIHAGLCVDLEVKRQPEAGALEEITGTGMHGPRPGAARRVPAAPQLTTYWFCRPELWE